MLLAHGNELHAHPFTGSDISDQRRAADFAFGHRKQQCDGSADGRWRCALNEETAYIQIADARDTLHAVMLPGDPDAFWRRDPRVATIALRWINQRS